MKFNHCSHFYNSVALSTIIFFCNHHHHSLVELCLPKPKLTFLPIEYSSFVRAQSFPTLYDPVDYSLPGSSAPGIFQARMLEWVAICYSIQYSYSRINVQASRVVGGPKLSVKFYVQVGHFL